jgi:hypothetical protein
MSGRNAPQRFHDVYFVLGEPCRFLITKVTPR